MEELKNCPFCDAGARREMIDSNYIVMCSVPSCPVATDIHDEQCNADAEWNRRPGEEAARAQGAAEAEARIVEWLCAEGHDCLAIEIGRGDHKKGTP